METKKKRKPGRKPVAAEHEMRVSAAMDMLIDGKSDGEIKRALAARFDLSPRTVERFLRSGRARLAESAQKDDGKDRDQRRRDAIAVYQRIIDNPEAEDRDVIKAQERIDRLLGLEQHFPGVQRVEVTGKDGGAIQQQAAVVTLDLNSKINEFSQQIRNAALANLLEQGPEKNDVLGLPSPR